MTQSLVGISAMYAVGDTHSHMFPVGNDGGEAELCWGTLSDTCPQWGTVSCTVGDTHSNMSPVGDSGGEGDLCPHVRSGGRSVTHVSSGGWERRGGSLPCTQWGTLTDTCP